MPETGQSTHSFIATYRGMILDSDASEDYQVGSTFTLGRNSESHVALSGHKVTTWHANKMIS